MWHIRLFRVAATAVSLVLVSIMVQAVMPVAGSSFSLRTVSSFEARASAVPRDGAQRLTCVTDVRFIPSKLAPANYEKSVMRVLEAVSRVSGIEFVVTETAPVKGDEEQHYKSTGRSLMTFKWVRNIESPKNPDKNVLGLSTSKFRIHEYPEGEAKIVSVNDIKFNAGNLAYPFATKSMIPSVTRISMDAFDDSPADSPGSFVPFDLLAMHEILHGLGLPHKEDVNSVMNPLPSDVEVDGLMDAATARKIARMYEFCGSLSVSSKN